MARGKRTQDYADPCTIGYRPRRLDGARPPSARSSPRSPWPRPRRSSIRWPRSRRSSRSASSTSSPCCSSPRSGAAGWARRRRWPARWRSTSSTSRRPGRFTISEGENWVALAVFFIAALVASTLAERARARTREAERAPPGGRPGRRDGAAAAARHEPRRGPAGRRRSASPTRSSCRRPRSSCARSTATSAASRCRWRRRHAARARRPAAARRSSACASASCRRSRRSSARRIERDALQREVVETERAAPLRRAQDRAAALGLARPALAADRDPHRGRRALGSASLSDERARRARSPTSARRPSGCRAWSTSCSTCRGWRRAPPSRASSGARSRRSCSAAVDDVALPAGTFALAIDPDLPLIRADAAQLERAFANLLENSARHSRRPPGLGPRARRRPADPRAHRRPRARRPRRRAGAHLRAVLPRAGRPTTATAARAWGWPSSAASSRPTAGACGSSRCPARARASSSSCPLEPARRMSDRPRVLVVDDERQILRALKVILREAGYEAIEAATVEEALDRAAVRPPDAAIVDLVLPDGERHRAVPAPARVDVDADHRAQRDRRGGREGRGARGRRRRLRDQAVRPARARGAARRRAAPRRRRARRAGHRGRRPASRPQRPRRAPRRRGGPPDADRVRPAARARAPPRPADDPPRAARRGLGPAVRRRHPGPARAHRQPAAQDRAAGERRYIRTDPGVGYRFAG